MTAQKYRNCILNGDDWYTENLSFKSLKHKVHTKSVCKLIHSTKNYKRHILFDGVKTWVHGHKMHISVTMSYGKLKS